MYNQPDEEFDRLCREAAENPEGIPSVDGWDKLRRKLDKEMPEKPDRRPGWLLWLPFLISIPLAMFYWVQYPASGKNLSSSLSLLQPVKEQEKKSDNQRESLTSTDTRNQISNLEIESPKRSVADPAAAPSNPTTPESQAGFGDERTITELSIKRTNQPNPKRSGKSAQGVARENQGKPVQLQSGGSTVQAFQKESSGQDDIKGSSSQDDVKESTVQDPSKKTSDQTVPTKLPVQTNKSDSSVQDIENKNLPASTPEQKASADSAGAEGAKEPVSSPIVNDEGFGFMAVFGPDFSNVHFAAGSKTGFSFGMLFEYHFNKRLSVQSGLIYEKKNYTAMGDDYGKIPGYDVNNPNFKMNKVDANCFMWEIPINVRYNFLSGKQHRVFGAGGFSSYLMRKEDLHYYYSYNNVNKYKNWMNDQSSAYWFAVANLSVGYEYRINQQFSVQAEPYFKIPVKGMGYGTVPISSMGILFGIRYRPMKGIDQLKK